jgi:mevalonate kinase
MVDTTKIASDIDGLADRQIKAGGMRLTAGSIMAIFAFLSTIVGGLYGGFVLYQKIEAVAGLDIEAYQQNMNVMDAKIVGISEKVEESVEYTRDIKNGLKDDILRIEQQTDRIEDMVRESEDKVRSMIDDAEVRFENQRERVRVSQSGSMKELEERLMDKLQRALDNPLAD